jgi:molecular chaperone HtpG
MSSTPKIGAYVLETLTTGMYSNALDCLREYLQNAGDSVWKAEADGVLGKNEGRVEVILDSNDRSLVIRDNGLGVKGEEVRGRLLNIGMSDKSLQTDAGFRGIGRLAGMAYCQKLHFRTKAQGEDNCSIVSFDCDSLKKGISPAMRQVEELASLLERNTSIETRSSKAADHFFEVHMEGVLDSVPQFLELQTIESYFQQVAPVPYDSQRFIYAPTILEYVKTQGINLPTLKLVLKAPPSFERQIFKSYKTNYRTSSTRAGEYKVEIKDIGFYPDKIDEGSPFWLWYGKSELLGMIDDETAAGLRFRKSNIALGGADRVAELFGLSAKSDKRFNSYFIGEIHVISPKAVPNARRDGFEDGKPWNEIVETLLPFIRERCAEIRNLSVARNRPTEKVVHSAIQLITEAEEQLGIGILSSGEKVRLAGKLAKELDHVHQATVARKDSQDEKRLQPIQKKLAGLLSQVENHKNSPAQSLNASLNRKQRKVIAEIIDLLHETLDESAFRKAKAAIVAKYGLPTG